MFFHVRSNGSLLEYSEHMLLSHGVVKYTVKERLILQCKECAYLIDSISYSINNACYYVPDSLVNKIKIFVDKIFTERHSYAKSASATPVVIWNSLNHRAVVLT